MVRGKFAWLPNSLRYRPKKRSSGRRQTLLSCVSMQSSSRARWLERVITNVLKLPPSFITTTLTSPMKIWQKIKEVRWVLSHKISTKPTRCWTNKWQAQELIEATRPKLMTWWARTSTCKTDAMFRCLTNSQFDTIDSFLHRVFSPFQIYSFY